MKASPGTVVRQGGGGGRLPAKKRQHNTDGDDTGSSSSSSSSAGSFSSPGSDDDSLSDSDGDITSDGVDDDEGGGTPADRIRNNNTKKNKIRNSFALPSPGAEPDSQEETAPGGGTGETRLLLLSTQPSTIRRTPTSKGGGGGGSDIADEKAKPKKRRKVSLSPSACQPGTGDVPAAAVRRTSPRRQQQTLASASAPPTVGPDADGDVEIIELTDDDHDDPEGGSMSVTRRNTDHITGEGTMAPGSKVQDLEFVSAISSDPTEAAGMRVASAMETNAGVQPKGGIPSSTVPPPHSAERTAAPSTTGKSSNKKDGNRNKRKSNADATTESVLVTATRTAPAPTKPAPQPRSSAAASASATASGTRPAPAAGRRPPQPPAVGVEATAPAAAKPPRPGKGEEGGEAKPAKKKKKKRTFEDELLHLLFVSCRPHPVRELMQMMGNASEATVQFCLLSLVDKQWVVKGEYGPKNGTGRTKELYWANQGCTSRELWDHRLDFVPQSDINAARAELGSLQQRQRALQQDLAQILQEPSNEELEVQCQAGERAVQALEGRLDAMRDRIAAASSSSSSKRPPVSVNRPRPGAVQAKPPSPGLLKRRINTMRDEWRKRKATCMDFVAQLADGMDKKVKDVVKLLELETDEAEGVTMPPRHVI